MINVVDKACSEFTLTPIFNISNLETPQYIAQALSLIGFKPKNAIVDISNYAMMDLGHPNHMYDMDKIEGKISVRRSRAGEEFAALNDVDYILPEGLLVVADERKVLSIAGVIGGRECKITDTTQNILLEVAHFQPEEVARSGRAINLSTDSRYRFERYVDKKSAIHASIIAEKVIKVCKGVLGKMDVYQYESCADRVITLDIAQIGDIAGFVIDKAKIIEILSKLGFILQDDGITMKVPSWRAHDIVNTADIAEEVLRMIGYDAISAKPLNIVPTASLNVGVVDIRKALPHILSAHEVISWAFMSSKLVSFFGFKKLIQIKNPISGLDIMRPSIIPNLLEFVLDNCAIGQSDYSLFECGHVYSDHAIDMQVINIAGVNVGGLDTAHHTKSGRAFDFFDAKLSAIKILQLFNIEEASLSFTKCDRQYYHPEAAANILLDGKIIGYCGKIHPNILNNMGINLNVVAYEVLPEMLPIVKNLSSEYGKVFSSYQAVVRDFAFIIDQDVSAASIVSAIRKIVEPCIANVDIFDVYSGANIEHGKKSVAVRILLAPTDRTLNDLEIEGIATMVINSVQSECGAIIRAHK